MTLGTDSRAAGSAPGDGHLARVRRAQSGSHVAALFDFDGTIIAGFSAPGVLQEKFTRGQMSAGEVIGTVVAMTNYWRGRIGFSGLMTAGAKYMKGVREDSFAQLGEDLYQKRIAGRIYPEIRAIIRAHQAKGHTVAIVSSATLYQIAPAARDLGIDRILCSRYEIVNGEFTGNIVRPLCFGKGKLVRRRRSQPNWASTSTRATSIPTATTTSTCFSASASRPLNPSDQLRSIAGQREWPVDEFSSRGTPGLVDYARALLPTPTLVAAALAGLPILALTRSTGKPRTSRLQPSATMVPRSSASTCVCGAKRISGRRAPASSCSTTRAGPTS